MSDSILTNYWRETAIKIASFHHEHAHEDEYDKCADYPCDLVNYPMLPPTKVVRTRASDKGEKK